MWLVEGKRGENRGLKSSVLGLYIKLKTDELCLLTLGTKYNKLLSTGKPEINEDQSLNGEGET